MRPLRPAALLIVLPALALAKQQPQTDTKTFLWKATAKNGNVVHLFGSIHMADESFYPLAPVVEEAFESSSVLAVEADIENMDAAKVMQFTLSKAALGEGRTLSKVVSKETRALLEKRLESLGMPLAAMEPFQPWYVAMTLGALSIKATGLDPELGLDRHFLKRRGDRKVVELEGMEFQIGLFAGFNLKQQEQLLVWTLADLDTMQREVERLVGAWKKGDTKLTEKLLSEGVREHPEAKPVVDALIGKRNATMTAKIEKMLQTKEREFVVVGAAHLVGDDGIVALLRKKGVKVEQL